MRTWESPLRSLRVAAVVAGAAAILVYANSLENGFAFDDNFIIQNPEIQTLHTLPGALLQPYWPGRYGQGLGLWRPVTTGVLGLQWALWGDNPVGYHAVNTLLHGGATGLVVLLLGGILPVPAAFLGGLVFAVHPLHVEAVANVVGVAELLAAFFFLLACLLVMEDGGKMGTGRLVVVLLCFAVAFLSKESAITLPGIVLLLDSSRRDLGLRDLGPYLRKRWPLYGGLAATAAVILMARYEVLGTVARPFSPLGAHILEEIPRIWTVASTWPHVARLLFFPQDLAVDYSPAVIPISYGWNAVNILGAVTVLTVLVLALLAWRRGPLGPDRLSGRAVGWGVVWFVITVSPTSNVLFLSGILLSERTLYLPSVGFVAAAAWVLMRLHEERRWLARGVMVLVLGLLAFRSWTRTPTWKDNLEVFNTLVAEHPESGRSQWILGDTYLQLGKVSQALHSYRLAIGILGGHYSLFAEIGRSLMGAGQDRAAEHLLQYAWLDRPELGFAPGLLAVLYDRQGRYPEAERAARSALAEDSTQAVQYHILSRSLEAQGRLTEARHARLEAIRQGEGGHWEQWGWLARLDLALGDTADARSAMDSARARALSAHDHRQIDSVAVRLGLAFAPDSLRETARDSQNPTHSRR